MLGASMGDPTHDSLGDYSPWGHKESDMTEQLIYTYTHRHQREITKMVRYGWK